MAVSNPENCSYQKKNHVDEWDLLNRACKGDVDYVYKVPVVGMDLKQHSDIYDMKVELVLKEGTAEDPGFLARPGCREHLGLVEGKSYLIMGRSVDLPEVGEGKFLVLPDLQDSALAQKDPQLIKI
ncbi:complement C3-like [Carassius auratus]|uniref:Complement C3-like n=1 Tax=Carassius auratus TaxID=7957 RepID=A0A6P6J560_CARAU|nr:complement C3-like [Carassius auratus]